MNQPHGALPAIMGLPNFRNLGVLLRATVLAEAVNLGTAISQSQPLSAVLTEITEQRALFEPVLIVNLLLLFVLSPVLAGLSYRRGIVAVLVLSTSVAVGVHVAFRAILPDSFGDSLWRTAFIASSLSALLLAYFDWRQRKLSPATTEARLMALQARIQPHFLFNSLNTVLALIRDDPRRAEQMLENLADLFRALMHENKTLVPLQQEIELARAYLEIESIRLGSRLRIHWQCDTAPKEALVPSLLLQPLLENAVYHGIEPSENGGEISVIIESRDKELSIAVRNPMPLQPSRRTGNRMALGNIRERIDLHYDAEGRLNQYKTDSEFVVQIRLPLQYTSGGRSKELTA